MRKAIVLIILLFATFTQAQEISVASFKMLENDLTANTTGTIEHDQNGEIAALIKVVSPEQGFVFDGGMVGIVKAKQEVGEVWVYVPHGIKRITVKHPTLGVLRDYYFPVPIEKARTYEMKLTTGRVETIVTHTVNKQFVMFNVKPVDAVVELNDEVLIVDGEGYAEKSMPLGTYNYRVSCANYQTEAGQITVTKDSKAEVNVTLRPNVGCIKLDGAEEYHGAHVFVDNERVGQLPLLVPDKKAGEHSVKVVKPLYKTYTQQVNVAAGDTVNVDVEMVANFAKVTVLSSDEQGEIWIDGKKMAVGKWEGALEIGEYKVEVKKDGHQPVTDVLSIYDHTERTFRLGAPRKLFTSVEISSRPSKAKVSIDGELVGETPLVKSDILVGEHVITFERSGYASVEKKVELKANTDNQVMAELVKSEATSTEPAKSEPVKEEKPMEEEKPVKEKAPAKAKDEAKVDEKGRNWRILLGANLASAYDPLYMGAEVGFSIGGFSLLTTVEHHDMGEYVYYPNKNNYLAGGQGIPGSIELLRFTARVGYSIPLGKHVLITPQVGMVTGSSCVSGGEYLRGDIIDWEEMESGKHYNNKVLAPDVDYTQMNQEIYDFVEGELGGLVVGVRFEVNVPKSRFGLHFTPEYFRESGGFAFGGGIVIRL